MCTLTWRAVSEGGYDLFFNRDELNTRGVEQPPRLEFVDGVAFAAPRDSDRGGSWLLANAHGLTAALLNDYACPWRPPANHGVSRGALVMACASAATPGGAAEIIGGMALERTGAFKMVVLGAGVRRVRLHWDGRILKREEGDEFSFETSSSFDTAAVCAARRQKYEAWLAGPGGPGVEELAAFHWAHDAADGAASVLMRRADARTRSVTRVSVRAGRVEMHYRPVGENVAPADDLRGVTVEFSRI